MHWISPFVGCEMGKIKAVLRKMPVFSQKNPKRFGGFRKTLYLCTRLRDVAQLVAHASGGREVASSSLVIPTVSLISG